MRSKAACLALAGLALGLVLAWQACIVHLRFSGHWNALFYTGRIFAPPPPLAPTTFVFTSSTGYDGQFYRYIAHDPFRLKGYERHIDAPGMRYRRILVPLAAWLLAAGHPPFIDAAYIALIALAAAAGVFFAARFCLLSGWPPVWSLAFLLLPATLISIDRLVTDGPLCTAVIAAAYFAASRRPLALWFALAAACLIRETGVLLPAAFTLHLLLRRAWRPALATASAVLPAFAWFLFLALRMPPQSGAARPPVWIFEHFGTGIFKRIFSPRPYPLPALSQTIAQSLDSLALAAILLAVALALISFYRSPRRPLPLAALVFAALLPVVDTFHFWDDPFTPARIFSPLLLLLACSARPRWPVLLAWLCVLLRTALQLAAYFITPR